MEQGQARDDVWRVEGGEAVLDAGVAWPGKDGGARARGVLAKPERGHRACWHVLTCFGRARSGQCRALALLGLVPSSSLSSVDAPGQGDGLRERPGRW